jgi:hypothetical protein
MSGIKTQNLLVFRLSSAKSPGIEVALVLPTRRNSMKTIFRKPLALLASLVGLLISLATSQAYAHAACFYSAPNFQGDSFCMRVAEQEPDLRISGFDNQIFSIQIPEGVRVVVCQETGFRGFCQSFTQDVCDLQSFYVSESVRSVYVQPSGLRR